jgi:DNA polymerase-3 subunit gamma/tau
MSQENLATRYRPQTFSQVAGQGPIKRILSRTAATGRVAPAYLFSGTRGVGKTTLARIFAKALNCQEGPAAEPCNQCPICRQVTQGAAVDVVEIDGASNTGVDNVRRLKEDVGYAPLECRRKVIIIDEAHMLSRQAFNALLKTLEEPPGHVTFIMATTEPEKFPQTIISRCQHFVFKRLPQSELSAHLQYVLDQEGVAAEPAAVQLLARRGAGSVRDSMSLLSQVLALGADGLKLSDVREVLGLAGSEVFLRLMEYVRDRDLLGLHGLLTEILDQGVDLGFFLRELAACWRNLFLLRQLGQAAQGMLDLPAEETSAWAGLAPDFALSHLHAGWQMVLDSQRRVLTSMEPALALELLLLNLAYLPDLLTPGASTPTASGGPGAQRKPAPVPCQARSTHQARPESPARPETSSFMAADEENFPKGPAQGMRRPAAPAAPRPVTPDSSAVGQDADTGSPAAPESASAAGSPGRPAKAAAQSEATPPPSGPRTWEGFTAFCQAADNTLPRGRIRGERRGDELVFRPEQAFLCKRLEAAAPRLADLAQEYYGSALRVRVEAPAPQVRKTKTELKDMAGADPVVREAQELFQARIMDVRAVNGDFKENDI